MTLELPLHGQTALVTGVSRRRGIGYAVAAELLELGIILNTINPGPVNTGYLNPASTGHSTNSTPPSPPHPSAGSGNRKTRRNSSDGSRHPLAAGSSTKSSRAMVASASASDMDRRGARS